MLNLFGSNLARARCCIRVTTFLGALPGIFLLHLFSPLHMRLSVPTSFQRTFRNIMYNHTYLLLATTLVATILVAPFPMNEPLQDRQSVNCTDPNAVTSGSCWEELHLAEFLTKWNEDRPICTTIDGTLEDGAHCCVPSEAWSTCFIRLTMGNHGYNCLNINEGTCPNFVVDASTAPEVRYILGTMYSKSSLGSHAFQKLVLTQPTRHQQLLQQLERSTTLRNAFRLTYQPASHTRDRSHPEDQRAPQRPPFRHDSRSLVHSCT